MSYTKSIKNELAVVIPPARCCHIAEIAGLINTGGVNSGDALAFRTENWAVAGKYFTLLTKTFKINADKSFMKKTRATKSSVYELLIKEPAAMEKVLSSTGVCEDGAFSRHISGMVVKKHCCKRSYIRGSFLAGGSVSSPDRGYHLEISLKSAENAEQFILVLESFEIKAKAIKRAGGMSVYIKDSAKIADFLIAAGAVNTLFEYENAKVIKEVRNEVNRLVNCDTANIKKTVTAAQKQIRAIELIERRIGISSLPEALAQTASLRLSNPDMRLSELGSLAGIGKSGINHRLRKIEAIAMELND